jgi:hypothetical protein
MFVVHLSFVLEMNNEERTTNNEARREAQASPDYSWFHTNRTRKQGPSRQLPSLARLVSVAHTAPLSLGCE